MAWLSPLEAKQITLRDYVVVGSCAVLLWDVFDNFRKDYRLLTRHAIRLPTVVYIIARLGAIGFALSAAIFASEYADFVYCAHFAKIVAVFYPIAVPAASLLFFFRLKAVFNCNLPVISFFAFVWLCLLASCILFPFGLYGARIGETLYCRISSAKTYIIAPVMISLGYDTLILIAISWKLMVNTHINHDIQTGVKTMVRGDYLPAFSRALHQDAQLYYMVTLPVNLVTAIMFCVTSIPAIYHVMLTVTNNVLMNIMASRVFRNTKLGLFQENRESSDIPMDGRSPVGDNHVLPLTFKSPRGTMIASNITSVPDSMMVIHVTQSIERDTGEEESVSESDTTKRLEAVGQ
ncbi:hypothetical protein BJ165DRAFT_1369855 [Panaeolus papilionaceus]|nr:hypothetical protein BJ165DRAFT_1369855 [Panaeolus papilionaceus]